MNRICVPNIVLLGALLALPAAAVQIEIQSSQHTTFITHGTFGGPPFETRTNFSSGPLDDFFTGADPSRTIAQASSSLFQILTLADVQSEISQSHAEARTGTEFNFSPLADTVASIQLEFLVTGQLAWGGNAVSLFDLTTGTALWTYFSEGTGSGNIPWLFDPSSGAGLTASLTLPTELLSSHDYRFRMSSWGSSSVPDSDTRLTQVSGFESVQLVPEPSAFALTALAGIMLANVRRKR